MSASLFSETPDQSLFVNAFNHASIGMALVGLDGRFIKVNTATSHLMGYSPEELVALDFQTLTHPDDLQADLGYVRQLLEGEITSYNMEKRYFSKNGSIVWVLLSVSLVRGQNQQPLHFISQLQNITALKEREIQLQEAQRRLEETNGLLSGILDGTRDLVAAIDPKLRFIAFNDAFRDEIKDIFDREVRIGGSLMELMEHVPEDRERGIAFWKRALAGEEFLVTDEFGDPNRQRRHYEIQYSSIKNSRGELIGAAHIVRNVTDRYQLEAAREESELVLRTFFESVPMMMGMVELCPERPHDILILSANSRAARFYGSTPEALKDRWASEFGSTQGARDLSIQKFQESRRTGQPVEFEHSQMKGSELHWFLTSVSYIGPSSGGRERFCYVASDITTRKQHEAQIERQRLLLADANAKLEALAVTDSLTGVKNRRAFEDALNQERNRVARHGTPFSLVMVDVDNFKSYNDTYGHLAGDSVLQILVRALNDTVRPTDMVARFGGEEFVIILHATDHEGALIAAERCRAAVDREAWPHRKVTISLGVSTYVPGMTVANLIDAADAALYTAKLDGKNCVRSTPPSTTNTAFSVV